MHMREGVLQVKGFIPGLIMIGAIVVELSQQSHQSLAGTRLGEGGDHTVTIIMIPPVLGYISSNLEYPRPNKPLDPTQVPLTLFIRYAGNRVKQSG